ncbi:hypothetical protein GCM10009753_77700 [Streptantibioticus ferralitis]
MGPVLAAAGALPVIAMLRVVDSGAAQLYRLCLTTQPPSAPGAGNDDTDIPEAYRRSI